MKSIGILGYGKLGQFLYESIEKSSEFQVSFVWNRSLTKLKGQIPDQLILADIYELKTKKCDLVIEVCHPNVIKEYGEFILDYCDLMIGSPTILANDEIKENIIKASRTHAIYIPTGALWGLEDIKRLDDCKELKSIKITMEKHPNSFKLTGIYNCLNDFSKENKQPTVIYDGNVKELCEIAPNNVNTMAVAALAATSLSFDQVKGCLISNLKNEEYHIITIEVETYSGLKVSTKRINPSIIGNVTGSATFMSFFQSLKKAVGAESGLHFC